MSPPYIVSRVSRAAKAVEQWENQYRGGGTWDLLTYGGKSHHTWADLKALGPDPDPDDVDRVIGNRTWTQARCDQCGSATAPVVVVGQPRNDSPYAQLCEGCMVEALNLLRETRDKLPDDAGECRELLEQKAKEAS